MTTIGISINSRMVGVAIVRENILVDFWLMHYKEKWSSLKRARILTALKSVVMDFEVDKMAIVIPPVRFTTKDVETCIFEIKDYFFRQGFQVLICPASTLHSQKEETKKVWMNILAGRYPELSSMLQKELSNERNYYLKLFEAVGAAVLTMREFDQ